MQQSENLFLQIIDNMKNAGYLKSEEAESIRVKYFGYVYDLSMKNKAASFTAPAVQNDTPDNQVDSPITMVPKEQKTVRERNLSWILSLGACFILISGIIFGTTSWGMLGSFGRVALLFCGGLLFFGVSVLAGRLLNLSMTSRAFWILGCLMLPVSWFTTGYLRLFGEYYSLFGQGKYLFGLTCSIVCLPAFIYSTYKLKSRIFSWLTLIDLEICLILCIASFHLKLPVFYLLVLVVHLGFIASNKLLKGTAILDPYLRETRLFIQLSLIVSSLSAVSSMTPRFSMPSISWRLGCYTSHSPPVKKYMDMIMYPDFFSASA